jgi:release factor glutamine methyltransferase
MRSAGDVLARAAWRLTRAGDDSARLDAELLLGKVLGWSRATVLAHPERSLSPIEETAFWRFVERRHAAEPIAYLLGEREFYGRLFRVDRRALIPRPETELLVDLGRAAVGRFRSAGVRPRVLDVGTGCGAVAVSLSAECSLPVIATDVSFAALSLARENVVQNAATVALVQADLLSGLRGPFHVMLANLPYVPRQRRLPPEVGKYEPHVALFGGDRGIELIERLLDEARPLLVPAGELAIELDEEDQATPVASLARQLYPGSDVSVRQDNGGYDRVVRLVLDGS